MGIINLTPDSFFDGGQLKSDKDFLNKVEEHLKNGAAILDLGAYSTRPGAKDINIPTETKRLIPLVELAVNEFPEVLLSADTFRSDVGQKAIEAGAFMINDVSGGNLDADMFKLVAQQNIPYVLMHMRGTPQTMSSLTDYNNLILDIKEDLRLKINELNNLGANQIIIDLGYGFAKTITQNFQLLKRSQEFKDLNLPILTGVSRKSMIFKTLNTSAKEALNGTSILNTVALLKGSKLLRVHDVKEAVEAVKLTSELT